MAHLIDTTFNQKIEVTEQERLSYRLGVGICKELRFINEDININLVIEGLKDAAEGREFTL